MAVPAEVRGGTRVLGVGAAGTFLTLVGYTTPLATLSSTARELGSDAGGQAWILSSMSVGLAVALLVSGAIGDDYGRRRVLVLGAGLLALTSVLAALTDSTTVLVLARIGQGVGGAAVLSCSLGLIGHAFPSGAQRTRATGMWGASVGAGIAVGPLAAAWLDEIVSWRAGYWLLAALSAAVALSAVVLLAESRERRSRPVDLAGAVLLGGGLVALLAGLVEGRVQWGRAPVLGLLVVGVLLVLAFVVRESRARAPMLDLALFRRPDFVISMVSALANGAGIIALMSYMSTFLQRGLDLSSFTAALVLFAWSGPSAVTALLARRLPARISVYTRLVGSLLVIAVGQALITGLDVGSAAWRLLPGLLLAGIGSGVLNAGLAHIAVASVPAGSTGVGSGANNTARYIGAAVGVTVVAVIAAHGGPAELVAGWNTAAVVTAGVSVLGAILIAVTARPTR